MMEIVKRIDVPTGSICTARGDKGILEFLSIGDYGQNHNIKADFLGLSSEIKKVEHKQILPLTQKWVITISTQYGCSMGCSFCDVPKVGPGVNVTENDLHGQVMSALNLHPEIKPHTCDRLNLHFARMGEPTWNDAVLSFMKLLPKFEKWHPVVSTMMPKANKKLGKFLREWCRIKNEQFLGNAGLQLSINSTNNEEREKMFNGSAWSIEDAAAIAESFPDPKGRKYTLNFALAGYTIEAKKLANLFPPSRFICKLTPMHETSAALKNGLKTDGESKGSAAYSQIEEKLKQEGFDVLVFVASHEEDAGLITCGNAILSGSVPKVKYMEVI